MMPIRAIRGACEGLAQLRPGRACRLTLCAILLAAAACSSDGGGEEPQDTSEIFLAATRDFNGYHGWPGHDVTDEATLIGIHDLSTVIAYLNQAPEPGSTEFPLGTVIVKEATGGSEEHQLFAMAKRGGGFNSGAPGWEWFELENLDEAKDTVKIVWRGFGPPLGEEYGGDAKGGCNSCHGKCPDSVCSKALALDQF